MSIFLQLFITLNVIPKELTPRDVSSGTAVGYALFVCFVLLALSKLIRTNIYSTLLFSSFKIKTIEQFVRTEHKLNSGASFLLFFNYLIAFSTLLFILFHFPVLTDVIKIGIVFLLPISLPLISILSLLFVMLITGETRILLQQFYFRVIGVQILGLLFFVIGVVWSVFGITHQTLYVLIITLLLIEFFLRVLKGVTLLLAQNVAWYYIILYFCTLEILPLIVLVAMYVEEF